MSSLIEPTNGQLRDFWFSLGDKELYEYGTSFLIGKWILIGAGRYTSNRPPAIQTSNGLPSDPIWIDANDPNRIPHIWDPSGNWIPVVPLNFSFPPQSPNPGDVWLDTNVMCGYAFGNNGKWNTIVVAGASNLHNSNYGVIPPGVAGPNPTGSNGILPSGAASAPIPVGSPGATGAQSISGNLQISTSAPSRAIMTISPSALKITGLVEIFMDGRIVYDPSYTPDKAAQAMWDAIAQFSPVYKEGQEVQRLRHDIDDYKMIIKAFEDAGFKLPAKKGPGNPNSAWDAAMGVII